MSDVGGVDVDCATVATRSDESTKETDGNMIIDKEAIWKMQTSSSTHYLLYILSSSYL